jgi:exodeoxyribonuclease VII large subunit
MPDMSDSGEARDPRRPQPMVWELGALLRAVNDALGARFGAVVVRGELGAWTRAASGHCYFTLKSSDGQAALRCALFRRAASLLDFEPREGMAVELRGRFALFEPRGELQMVVESMRRAGAGTLMEQFLQLKARLEAEGLFDPARKRPLPPFPARIGLVTSLAGAVLHDVVTALRRRAPHVSLVVYPAPVQGAQAGPQLAAAVRLAAQRAEVDVLLVCRGGGSLEDLWAFNHEALVRAIAASAVPVISGVGHETDFTLADFAADLRAPTPTAAAELVAPARQACLDVLTGWQHRMARVLHHRLDREAQRLDHAAARLARPSAGLLQRRHVLAGLQQRLGHGLAVRLHAEQQRGTLLAQRLDSAGLRQLERQRQRLELLAARLAGTDPRNVLRRGFAWIEDGQGRALGSVAGWRRGDGLRAVMADGELRAQVTDVQPRPDPSVD